MQIMAKLFLDAYVQSYKTGANNREVVMIVVNEKKDLLEMHVYGELTLADYRGFEEAVGRELKTAPKIKLFLDLTQMTGYTLDVAWEEIKFTRAHAHDFRRIAIVSETQMAPWLSWVSAAFSDAEARIFDNRDPAIAWLNAA
jgi:hypothetical protein